MPPATRAGSATAGAHGSVGKPAAVKHAGTGGGAGAARAGNSRDPGGGDGRLPPAEPSYEAGRASSRSCLRTFEGIFSCAKPIVRDLHAAQTGIAAKLARCAFDEERNAHIPIQANAHGSEKVSHLLEAMGPSTFFSPWKSCTIDGLLHSHCFRVRTLTPEFEAERYAFTASKTVDSLEVRRQARRASSSP
jgi:hypothetical protein